MIKIDLKNGQGILEVKGDTADLLKEWGHITEQVALCVRKSTQSDEDAKLIMKTIFKEARKDGLKLYEKGA